MPTSISILKLDGLKLEVKLKGHWVEATHLPVRVALAMKKGYDNGVDAFSKRFLTTIKRAISTGMPPKGSGVKWEPLSPKTIQRYGMHQPYMITGLYKNSIKLFKSKTRTYIGLNRGKASGGSIDARSKLSLSQVARVLEYGNEEGAGSGIPPRPVWGPTLISIGGKERLKKYIVDSIKSQLRAKGIKVRKT